MNRVIEKMREKWMGTMTDRERFNRQMHYQPVDRCYNREFGYWTENFTQWAMFRENGITCSAEANRFFGFDWFSTVSGNIWMHPLFEEKVIEDRGSTQIIQNADGLLAEIPKGHSCIPHFLKSPIE